MPIQKIIHHIWTSGNSVAPKFHKFIASWEKCNPTYKHMLWEIDNLEYDKYSESSRYILQSDMNYEVKMDVVTWEILNLYGGIKADVDVMCQKSFDPLLKDDSFCGEFQNKAEGSKVDLCVAVTGIKKGHELCRIISNDVNKAIIDHWEGCFKGRLWKYCEEPAKPYMRMFDKVYDKSYFFPFAWDELYKRTEKFPDAYAVHYWGGCDPGGWVETFGGGKVPLKNWGGNKKDKEKFILR